MEIARLDLGIPVVLHRHDKDLHAELFWQPAQRTVECQVQYLLTRRNISELVFIALLYAVQADLAGVMLVTTRSTLSTKATLQTVRLELIFWHHCNRPTNVFFRHAPSFAEWCALPFETLEDWACFLVVISLATLKAQVVLLAELIDLAAKRAACEAVVLDLSEAALVVATCVAMISAAPELLGFPMLSWREVSVGLTNKVLWDFPWLGDASLWLRWRLLLLASDGEIGRHGVE